MSRKRYTPEQSKRSPSIGLSRPVAEFWKINGGFPDPGRTRGG